MGGYSKKDAARDTGSSPKDVSRAWHDAKDAAQKSGQLPERAASKAQQSGSGKSGGGGKK
jgi:hypothetical protein